MDLYNRKARVLSIKKKFKEICLHCFQIVEKFEHELKIRNYSIGRIEKYWSFLKTIHLKLNKCFDKVEKEDIENLVIAIENENWSEWTKSDFKKITKFFFRWLINGTMEGEYPSIVRWIKTRKKKNEEKKPEQILTKEEIELLASKAENQRDKALVLILYESGCRISEFLNMRIKDVVFDQYGCYILVSGKTGWRRVRIIEYSKELFKWLDIHPLKENPEAYVWPLLYDPHKVLTPDRVNVLLKKLARKAGIAKRVHAHAFRHARATHLAKHLPEAIMKEFFGWTKDSKMASVYYHLSGKDVDEALLKIYGLKPQEEAKPVQLRICPNCGESNTILTHFCRKCNAPLDLTSVWREKDETVAKILEELRKDGWFAKKVVQTIKKLGLEHRFL